MEQDQRGGDDVADAPGAAAPAAERLEAGLEQAVGAFAEAAQGAMDGVVGLLVRGQLATGGFLDRDAEDLGLAFVAQIGQPVLPVVDPGGDLGEQVGVGAGGGGVVLAARAYRRGSQRPAVGGGDDLDVPTVMAVLPAPPQIHPAGRAGGGVPVGGDQGAVHDHVGVAGGLGRQ
jgi:hypothetical protein